MILKEKQLTNSQDYKIRAGEDAEKQMAFYLQRSFAKKDNCFVLNDLRVIHNDDVAQIDHLIVTQFGLFIIESKSVHGKIIVNKHDEWSRTYNKEVAGMPSPVLQAEAQGRILKELLRTNADTLLGKLLFGKLQKGFKYCPIFVYVAISDTGIINREKDVPELFKADQITKSILTKLDELKQRNSPLSLSLSVAWEITKEETQVVAEFLLSRHEPTPQNSPTIDTESITKLGDTATKNSDKSFVPRVGAICPVCKKHNLIRKSVPRNDKTETDFLACAAYPIDCKAIFALIAVAKHPTLRSPDTDIIVAEHKEIKENDSCPRCKVGKLVLRKAKTTFLGCSQYPKCKFTDYRY